MKYLFLAAFFSLIALSVLAMVWQPRDVDDRTELVWVTGESNMTRAHAALFNAYSKEYRVTIDQMNSGLEKVIVQTIAGVGADLYDVHTSGALAAFVQMGTARDCTDELAALGITAESMWPCLEPLYIFDGRMYGLPPNTHAPAIWFNKDHFDEIGEPYPQSGWTWEEFVQVALRLTQRDTSGKPERYGMLGTLDAMLYYPLFRQWGAALYTPEGTRCIIDSPEGIAAIDFAQRLIYDYKIMPTPADETAMATSGGWGQGAMTLFGNGRGSMAIGGRWWLVRLRDPEFRHLRLGSVELPRGKFDRNFGSGRAVIVSSTTKHLEGCLEFLAFMQGQPYNDLINTMADGVAPVIRYNYSEVYTHNPEFPEEDFHEVWRTAVEKATPMETSLYANGIVVEQILLKQMDLVRFNVKSAADAMRDAAKKINEAIVEQLKADDALWERYQQELARGAAPAWDRPEDAPHAE